MGNKEEDRVLLMVATVAVVCVILMVLQLGNVSSDVDNLVGEAFKIANTNTKMTQSALTATKTKAQRETEIAVDIDDIDNTFGQTKKAVRYVCDDSDDGKDYETYGVIEGVMESGSEGRWGDSCYSDGETLVEFYCGDENLIEQEVITCEFGCNDGACVESSFNANFAFP